MSKLNEAFKPSGSGDASAGDPTKRLPQLFAVISRGCAGTNWLTKILNAHPEVFCVHNLKNHCARETGTLGLQDDLLYLQIISRTGRNYRLAGDCHGVSRESIPALRNAYGERFSSAVLTRHPVSRLLSHWAIVEKAGIRHYSLDYASLRGTLPASARGFFSSEEQLTSDFNEVNRLLGHLSKGELKFVPEMIQPIFNRPVTSHRGQGKTGSPEEDFGLFSDWQQEAFRMLFTEDARKLYGSLGYDLSFTEQA